MKRIIPYGFQWISEDDIKAVTRILKSDFLTQGPEIEKLEYKICKYTGAKYCVALSNGTAALHLAVLSLEIEKGKEGITSPNTFVASANCLIYGSLKPVFADIDAKTYNINPEEIKKRITKNTKVIVTVDFAGQPADMKKIHWLAKDRCIYVIEDASHAIGSKYEDGSKVGGCKYSDLTVFSFHPVKTITTGEGGAVTTNSKKLYLKLKLLRNHGITKDSKLLNDNPGPWYYEMKELGFNYRITDIQAALGISQLGKLDKFVKRRKAIVDKYNHAFNNIPFLTVPFEKKGVYSAYHIYVLQIDFNRIGKSRKQVMDKLREKGIGTQVHYIPVHTQPYYKNNYGYKIGDYPVAEEYYSKGLSIPLFAKMTDADVACVINNIKRIVKRQ